MIRGWEDDEDVIDAEEGSRAVRKEKLGVGRGLIGRHHNCPTGQQELSWPPNPLPVLYFLVQAKTLSLPTRIDYIQSLF